MAAAGARGGAPAEATGGPLSPEQEELMRDGDDLRRLQNEIEAAWSDEAPLRLDVQSLLFEAEMELEKAVLGLGQERRRREAQGVW